MRLTWRDLGSARAETSDGQSVEVEGFAAALTPSAGATRFMLTFEPGCCPGCMPRDRSASVEIFAASAIPPRGQPVRLSGSWRVQSDDPSGWRYQLHGARLLDPPGWGAVTRRGVLVAGPLMCLAACAAADAPAATSNSRLTRGGRSRRRRPWTSTVTPAARQHNAIRTGRPFSAVAEPMRQGGMAAICLAVVSDGPTHRVMADGRIHPYREPDPGELYQYGQLAFARVHDWCAIRGWR